MNGKERKDLERRVQEYLNSLPPASLSDAERQEMTAALLRAGDEETSPQQTAPRLIADDHPPPSQLPRRTPAWVYAAAAVVILAAAISIYQRWTASDADTLAQRNTGRGKLLDSTEHGKSARTAVRSRNNDAALPGEAQARLAFAPVQAVFTFRNKEIQAIPDSVQMRTALAIIASVLRRESIEYTADLYSISTSVEVEDISPSGRNRTTLRFNANFAGGEIDVLPAQFALKAKDPDEGRLRRILDAIREEIYKAARGV